MTALERMARAICLEYNKGCGFDDDGAKAETDLIWQEWTGEARAALVAIREPDEAMVSAYCEAVTPEYYSRSIRSGFTAMIDAILNEETA